jgi:P pilus assembly chaperone PapD
MKNVLFAVLLLPVVGAVPAAADISLDVTPLRLELKVEAGGEYTDAIEVTNLGDAPVRLKAYLQDWFLDEVGTPNFQTVGLQPRTASPWVGAAPSDFLLDPGEAETVRFTVTVPGHATTGGYHASIMLETNPVQTLSPEERGVVIRGRVATILYVTVGEPEADVQIREMARLTREDGSEAVTLRLENTGGAFFRLAGALEMVAQDRDLLTSVELPDVPVLPGTTRTVTIDLPEGVGNAFLARARIDVKGAGVLLGECRMNPVAGVLAR